MPSPSPNKSIETFHEAVDGHTARFQALTSAIEGTPEVLGFSNLQLRRGLAEDYFFRVATDWQLFQHDWTIRAIAHRPSALTARYQRKLDRQLEESGVNETLSLFTTHQISIPSIDGPLPQWKVRKILDDRSMNLEFPTSKAWSDFARRNLSDPHKNRLISALSSPESSSFLDMTRQLRN